MAMKQLIERPSNSNLSFGLSGGKQRLGFLRELNESRGKITPTISFNFKDKQNEYTVPHMGRNWDLYKRCYQKIGVVSNAIDNTANFAIQSGYELEGSEQEKKRVQEYMDKHNLDLILLNVMKQMMVYGNAYLEITDTPKLLPIKNMFVRVRKGTNDDGEILGYRQKIETEKHIDFKPEEILHFKWREIGTEFYGNSDIEPNLGILTRLLNFQDDVGEIMHNYAHPIIHYKLGSDENPAASEQIDDFIDLRNKLRSGEDLVTSHNIEHEVISADLRMIQIDGMLKHMENQLIAGLQVPEIFVRGGQSSNKATADVELQAFDRKVKALRAVVGEKVREEIFINKLNADVKLSWHEMSVESEALKAEMMVNLVNAGVPTPVALRMTGWGSWLDDYEKADKERQKDMQQPPLKRNDTPKEDEFDTQDEWAKAMREWKKRYKNESEGSG